MNQAGEHRNVKTLCVLGLGYIGLPTASMFATHGVPVTGVDVKQAVIDILNNGGIHIQEPGLRTLVRGAMAAGYLNVAREPAPSDAFIIAVPTPINADKTADMRYVIAAAESVVPHLREGNLVILESTSPPRTTVDLVQPILERSGLKAGEDFFLAYSPERVLPGHILRELVENSRVIGGIDPASAEAGRDLYAAFVEGEIVLTDATTAEMVKLMENTYRDINIAAANEFARLAEHFQVNVWEAIAIANRHPRVEILRPGPGVGGHCISVDPWFFVETAPEIAHLIRQARVVNDEQPAYVVQQLSRVFGDLAGRTFAALGVTYKSNVDDMRESPAVAVIHHLQRAGATVRAYDPYVAAAPELEGALVSTLDDAIRGADGVLLLVDHREFKSLAVDHLAGLLKRRFILDTRCVLPRDVWEAAGFDVMLLGDGRERWNVNTLERSNVPTFQRSNVPTP
ncbi:MAG: nucleotide sugar dehydrogenase [Anaerolineae bacterium]|nr:nucleotide sugar dehydrogenase [Anaerolineae bacterium]